MWNIAEPFSPSSWLNAHVPMSRSVALVDGHRQRLGARRPARRRSGRSRRRASARPGSARGARPRGPRTSAERGDVLRRRAAAARPATPSGPPGTTSRAPSPEPVYHPRHAALERARRARRGHHPDVREDRPPRRLPPHPRRPTSCRSRSSSSPAGRSPRPTSARPASAGRRSRPRSARSAASPGATSARPTTATPTSAWRSTTCSTAAGHAPPPDVARRSPRSPPTFAAIEARLRARPRRRRSSRASSRGPTRRRPRASSRSSAASCGSGCARASSRRRSPRPSTARSTPSSGPGMLTGDIGRPAELARDDRLDDAELALFHPLKFMLASPAEDAAEIITRLGPDGLGRGQVRRHPRPAPQARRRTSASTRATCTTSARQFPEVVDAARPLPWDRHPRRRAPGLEGRLVLPFISLQARLGRKAPSAAIQAEVPVIYVAFDARSRSGAGDDPRGDATVEPLLREPLRERRRAARGPRPAARRRRRPVRPLAPRRRADDVDALEAAFDEARARRNEGLMVKDPTSDLLAGPARLRLAEDEEGARDDRLRRRRRRGRARQAPRRPLRLHVRRPRHDDATSSSPSARPTAG